MFSEEHSGSSETSGSRWFLSLFLRLMLQTRNRSSVGVDLWFCLLQESLLISRGWSSLESSWRTDALCPTTTSRRWAVGAKSIHNHDHCSVNVVFIGIKHSLLNTDVHCDPRSPLCTWCWGCVVVPRRGRRSPTPPPRRTSTRGRRSSSRCSSTTRYSPSEAGAVLTLKIYYRSFQMNLFVFSFEHFVFCRWTKMVKSTVWGASVRQTSAEPACSWRVTSTVTTVESAASLTASTSPRTSRLKALNNKDGNVWLNKRLLY